ncbi:MAG TPA: phage tail protein [Candidatus Binataceae bacterium]|nr:phage tail protein [Candidatus Binataceae bacterium]
MAQLQIQQSINDARSQALLVLIERLDALDLTTLLIYRIESVVDSALPFLAWQFDILSPFWQLLGPAIESEFSSVDAITDIDTLTSIDFLTGPELSAPTTPDGIQRALLENAIALHRIRGTPAAIKNALAQLGWSSSSLLEGQQSWGGTSYPSSQGWAVFRIMIDLAADEAVDAEDTALIVAAVDFFKPARAWLDSVWFVLPPLPDDAPVPTALMSVGGIAQIEIDNAPSATDTFWLQLTPVPLADQYGPISPLYDNHYRHSGITYGVGEPTVADSALLIGGGAVLQGG